VGLCAPLRIVLGENPKSGSTIEYWPSLACVVVACRALLTAL
jgi:hypothetical protein